MEQEPMEVRLAHFMAKMEALKKLRAKDATIQSIGDVGKLEPDEMVFWERYTTLLKSVEMVDDDAVTAFREQVDTLIRDIKQTEAVKTDEDILNFYDWMRNRLVGLLSFAEYLDDSEIKKEILVELAIERKELEL